MSLLDFTLPGSDPTTPNAFIQTPQQVAYQQELARQLMQKGSDYSPVQSPWQGAARMGQALVGALANWKANSAQRLGQADATADQSNVLNRSGIFNDPGEQIIPATPGQTTPALAESDRINDAVADAQDGGLDPRRVAMVASLGGSVTSPAPASNSALATGLANYGKTPAAPSPSPLALAAGLGAGTPYGASNVGSASASAGTAPDPHNYPVTQAGQVAFIRDYSAYAGGKGIDPNFALGVGNAEGLRAITPQNPNGASTVDRNPDGSPFSFGAFQLNVRNGLGNAARAAGIDPSDPAQANLANKFALDYMAKNGLAPWKGDAAVSAYQAQGGGWTPPALAAISAATGGAAGGAPGAPGAPNASAYAPAGQASLPAATSGAPPPGEAGRPLPAAAESALTRTTVPPSEPEPSPSDMGALRTAMTSPTPALGTGASGLPAQAPAPASPSPFPAAPNAAHADVAGLLRIMSNPWSSPAAQQVASSLLQTQLPQRPTIIDGPTDPTTGYATKLVFSPTQGVLGRLNADGTITPAGGAGTPSSAPSASGAPTIPQGVDPKKYRETLADRDAAQATPSASDELNFTKSVREFPSYQEYAKAIPTYNAMVTSHIADNTPAGDKAIVDDFAKILNPGRSVTTGAFVLNLDAQSLPAELAAKIQKAWNGNGELGPDARAQMAKIAQDKMLEYQSAWNTDASQATATAKAHNLNVGRVVPSFPALAPLDLSKVNTTKTMAAPARASQPQAQQQPPVQGARQAPDGNWYVADPNRAGKYLMVR